MLSPGCCVFAPAPRSRPPGTCLLTRCKTPARFLILFWPRQMTSLMISSDTRLIRDTVKSVRQSLTRSVSLPTELLAEPERLNLSLLFPGRFGTLRPFVPVFDSDGCRTLSSPATLAGTLTHTDHTSLFHGGKTLGAFLPLGRFPDPTFGGTIPDLTQPISPISFSNGRPTMQTVMPSLARPDRPSFSESKVQRSIRS